jgi:hypothetical protein
MKDVKYSLTLEHKERLFRILNFFGQLILGFICGLIAVWLVLHFKGWC